MRNEWYLNLFTNQYFSLKYRNLGQKIRNCENWLALYSFCESAAENSISYNFFFLFDGAQVKEGGGWRSRIITVEDEYWQLELEKLEKADVMVREIHWH